MTTIDLRTKMKNFIFILFGLIMCNTHAQEGNSISLQLDIENELPYATLTDMEDGFFSGIHKGRFHYNERY